MCKSAQLTHRIVGFMLAVFAANFAAAAAPTDVQPYSMKQLFDVAANPLGWQRIAGQTVGVYGGHFFNVARVPNGNNLWLISLRTSQYTTDMLSCLVSDDTLSVTASFKPNDPVIVIGKLAGSPHDNRPAFDGRCFVASGNQPAAGGAASSGPLTPTVTTTVDQFQADLSNNSVAFEQKYLNKVVRLTGGHISRIGPDLVVVYRLAGPHKNFPLDVVNCLLQPAAKAGVASLNKDQNITVTGTLKKGDETKTADLAPILENCTY